MEKESLLSAGITKLYEIRKKLVDLQAEQTTYQNAVRIQKKLEKQQLEQTEKMEKEIENTIRKRREEQNSAFEEQNGNLIQLIKETERKKEKLQNQKKEEQIKKDIEPFIKENQQLKEQIRGLIKEEKVPRFCMTKAYDILFSPMGLRQIMFSIGSVLLLLFIIPYSVYSIFFSQKGTFYFAVFYFLVVTVLFGLYLLGYHKLKWNYQKPLKEIRRIKQEMKMNQKQMKMIATKIQKKTVHTSEVASCDAEVKRLKEERIKQEQKKQAALQKFEQTVKPVLIAEIQKKSEQDRNAVQERLECLQEEIKQSVERIRQQTLEITEQYEGYLGKELLTLPAIDALIDQLHTKPIQTIAEAIEAYQAEKR